MRRFSTIARARAEPVLEIGRPWRVKRLSTTAVATEPRLLGSYPQGRSGRLATVLDERWIRSLHVETLREVELHAEREAHVLFQASTIGALLAGSYDGDLTFAELAEHGDLGLGTLNGLDGEMIAVGGRFFRADVDGAVTEVAQEERTPFAVVTNFSPAIDAEIVGPLDHEGLLAKLDELIPAGAVSCSIRLDGRFEAVRARSVPRQSPPYRPLAEVAAEQHVFELADVEGTMLGFRFPDYVEGIEVSGFHLHFIDADRRRGGHVLGSRSAGALRVRLDPSGELHVELPPGIELADPNLAAETHAAIERVERGG
jgi:acetolactate decarboxylase